MENDDHKPDEKNGTEGTGPSSPDDSAPESYGPDSENEPGRTADAPATSDPTDSPGPLGTDDSIRSRLISLREKTRPFLRHPLRGISESAAVERTAEFFRGIREDLTGTHLTTPDGRPLPAKERLVRVLQRIDLAGLAEKSRRAFLSGGRGALWGKFVTIALSAWFLADVVAIGLESFVPEPPAPRMSARFGGSIPGSQRGTDTVDVIVRRNLFSSRGLIPGEEGGVPDLGGQPVKSTLPLALIGTVILTDPGMSVAAIEDRSLNRVLPVRIEDEIIGKAKILEILPRQVIFINTASGRREFIELPEEGIIANTRIAPTGGAARADGPGVEQLATNQYNVNRSEIETALADMSAVLTQARAVPNLENGVTNGYKLFQIKKGSIYEKLGLKNGDVLCGLNGEPINDPGKAFALMNELKTASHVDLCVKRGGKTQNYAYEIR